MRAVEQISAPNSGAFGVVSPHLQTGPETPPPIRPLQFVASLEVSDRLWPLVLQARALAILIHDHAWDREADMIHLGSAARLLETLAQNLGDLARVKDFARPGADPGAVAAARDELAHRAGQCAALAWLLSLVELEGLEPPVTHVQRAAGMILTELDNLWENPGVTQ